MNHGKIGITGIEKGRDMTKEELELKLEKQCKRLCKVANEFNQLRANIELTKKQITEAQVENT